MSPFSQSKGQIDKTENLGKIIYLTDGTNFFPVEASTAANSTMARLVLGASTANIGDIDVLNTETILTELRAAGTLAASTVVLSSTISVAGVKRATVFIDHSRAATAAFTTNGTEYRVDISQKASGNDTWRALASVLASSAVAASAAASSDCAAGTTLVTITSGTAIPANDNICFTSGTIEWVRSTIATGTASFNIIDGTTYGHASATGLFGSAEHFVVSLNLEAATRLRVVINNQASAGTQPIVSRIACITEQ